MGALIPVSKDSCPVCGEANPTVITYSDTVEFRGLLLDVEKLQESKCHKCRHKWSTQAQRTHNNLIMRDAYITVRDELRAKEGLLTGQEIAQLREMLKINQREAAALFGGGYNAFNKYESGEVLQSFPMDRLLRLTAAVGLPAIDFLKDVFSPPQFVVMTVIRPNEIRITVGTTGIGFFTPSVSHGNSLINKYESIVDVEWPKVLPSAQEMYLVK